MILRLLDALLAALGLLIGAPLLFLLLVLGLLDTGSPLFRQTRIGRNQKPFILVKFRTMRPNTAHVATHLVDAAAVTRWGSFLRRTKMDELPQLWNVLKGEMSLVGPRPCLPNQTKLIAAREQLGVFNASPGITGLAQIKAIDMSQPELLAETDAQMLRDLSWKSYLKYILLTVLGRGAGDRVKNRSN